MMTMAEQNEILAANGYQFDMLAAPGAPKPFAAWRVAWEMFKPTAPAMLPDYTGRPSDAAAIEYTLTTLHASGDIDIAHQSADLVYSPVATPCAWYGLVTEVHFVLRGRDENYTCVMSVWHETREDGSTYLYGEW